MYTSYRCFESHCCVLRGGSFCVLTEPRTFRYLNLVYIMVVCESQRVLLRDPVLESDALPLCSGELGNNSFVSDFASVRTVREPSRIRECAFVNRCDVNTYTKPYNTQIMTYHCIGVVFLLRDVS